jgi:hypothetical protein
MCEVIIHTYKSIQHDKGYGDHRDVTNDEHTKQESLRVLLADV